VPLPIDELRELPLDEQLAFVLDRLKLQQLVPRGFGLPWFRGYFQAFRANRRAMWRYRAARFDGPAVLFRVTEDPRALPIDLGWTDLLPRLAIERVPGDHATMLLEPHVHTLAARLNARIHAALHTPSVADRLEDR
jgi:thioesterase domain-containing protein